MITAHAFWKALRTAWREGLREFKRQQRGARVADPFKETP
jgi:hypothetical protein